MTEFMLWYDSDRKTTTAQKIATAAEYYRKKYGGIPNLCFCNPEMIDDSQPEIETQADAVVIPHHFLIGVNEQKKSTNR